MALPRAYGEVLLPHALPPQKIVTIYLWHCRELTATFSAHAYLPPFHPKIYHHPLSTLTKEQGDVFCSILRHCREYKAALPIVEIIWSQFKLSCTLIYNPTTLELLFTHSDFSTDSIILSFLLFVFVLGCVDLMSKLGFHTAVDVCVCFFLFINWDRLMSQAGTQPKRKTKGTQ